MAASLPVGRFVVGANGFPDFEAFWTGPTFTLGRQVNGYFSFGLFDRISMGVRVTDRRASQPQRVITVYGPSGYVLSFPLTHVDLSPNVQVLLLPEASGLPALAVGAYDLTGTGYLEGRYVVASRSLGRWARVSAGYGVGPDLLDGPFGGAEVHPTPWTSFQGEWDGERMNLGAALRPTLPGRLGAYVTEPEVRAYWAQDNGWYVGGSFALPWDGDLAPPSSPAGAPEPRGGGTAANWVDDWELQARLAALGLENVRVSVTDSVVGVEYENRAFLQNQLDALTRVLGVVGQDPRRESRRAEITVLASERPVLRAKLPVGRSVEDAISSGLDVIYPDGASSHEAAEWAGASSSSRGRADLILRPALATHLAWEKGLADARIGLVPTLEIPLHRGLTVALGYSFPLWQSEGMLPSRGPLPGSSVELALLSFMATRAVSPRTFLAGHWSAGRFNGGREGVRQQTALYLLDGRLRLDADVAATRVVGDDQVSVLALAGGRWLVPELDTRLSFTTGRHLHGDWGFTVGMSRFFGDTEVAITVKESEHGSQGVFQVSLPLTGERSLRPGRLRPRAPSLFSHRQTSTLFTGGGNYIALDIAEGLRTSFEGWDRLQDRDRLHPAMVREAVTRSRFGSGR